MSGSSTQCRAQASRSVARGGARLAPEGDVLAVGPHRQPRRVQAAGVGSEGRLHHRQDAVGGDLDPVPQPLEALHHALHGGHHAPARRPRPPRPLEQRLGQRHVAVAVGDRPVEEGDVGHERRHQTHRPEGGVGHGEGVVRRHRRPLQRPGDQRRQPPRRSLEALGEGEDRPVLDLHRARGVGLLEHGVGRVGGEGVARVGRHHLAHHAAPEEQGAERAQAEHHEGEAGVRTPVLARHLARRRGPPAVPAQDLHGVARAHVVRQRVLERDVLHRDVLRLSLWRVLLRGGRSGPA